MGANPDRSSYFPAIEKKYGQPMSYWFGVMKEISDLKYADQMAYLQENYGFSRAHGNALILYSRGNTSSRRYNSLDDYAAAIDPVQARTVRAIFQAIQAKYRDLELVIAWNQPMLKRGKTYVFGVSTAKQHILIAPFDPAIVEEFRPRLEGYKLNKKTIQVPSDWKVDKKLLTDMVGACLAEG